MLIKALFKRVFGLVYEFKPYCDRCGNVLTPYIVDPRVVRASICGDELSLCVKCFVRAAKDSNAQCRVTSLHKRNR
jgi:hypothetical protein